MVVGVSRERHEMLAGVKGDPCWPMKHSSPPLTYVQCTIYVGIIVVVCIVIRTYGLTDYSPSVLKL